MNSAVRSELNRTHEGSFARCTRRFASLKTCQPQATNSWQNPASAHYGKTLPSCQQNGQRPPLSRFCNKYIIPLSKITFELAQPRNMYCEQRANYVLDLHLPLADPTLSSRSKLLERRTKPRSSNPLPARVWGVDTEGHPFSLDCLLDNISASGLYLRLPRKMNFSSAISIVVRLLQGPREGTSAAIKGTVIRNEWKSDGHTGVGVRIVEHRFI